MNRITRRPWVVRHWVVSLMAGLIVGVLSMFATVQFVSASTAQQSDDDTPVDPDHPVQDCQECHLDVARHWEDSAHAHAFDDEVFQAQWLGLGEPGECLACHTTNYQPATGEFDAVGVECTACHGEPDVEHPPNPIPILADTEYCGTCHTTTLGEWHRTGHATSDIGCMDCHDPHSQDPLFEDPDDLCINCHEEEMGDYLEDLHVQEGIGCVDCHALVVPPEHAPDDGIVPTGHAFDISPATCVACHTDALHSGFSLPGYEHGAKAASATNGEEVVLTVAGEDEETAVTHTNSEITPAQTIQALETALASQNVTTLFQGGIVGLVLGGSSAWFVASNVRQRRKEDEDDD
ncbi:MAG: hypothetical protein GY943_32220 [Chloroflexi bacterium]|nr:hypothetical protein [Chloroflexota bacterium]